MDNMDPACDFEDDWLLSGDEGADVGPLIDSRPSTPLLESIDEDEASLPVFGPQKKRGLTIGQRMEALWMFERGEFREKITEKTAVSTASLYKIRTKAISNGWIPGETLEPRHVDDQPRSGRPKVSQFITSQIIQVMTKNSTTRGWSSLRIAQEVSSLLPGKQFVSASTVYRTLTTEGYGSYKRTVKPGLNEENRKLRLKWCQEHSVAAGWDLERWKNVIWTDETSVQLSSVRGKRRIWRKAGEAYHPHVIVRRWKGFQEFMWWSAFSYDKKGPYYIWPKETDAERKEREKQAKIVVANWNAARYADDLAEWELNKPMSRLRVRVNVPGPKPAFRHAENGAYILNNGKGGINWYRHQDKVLKPYLFPFAKECQRDRPDTIVMEDGASPHASQYSSEAYCAWEIERLLWPANSPDLNMIEPCWFYMKLETTKHGAIHSEEALREAWIKCWDELPQSKIQAWIERIVEHIAKVILLEGGNEYKEGRLKGQLKQRVH